MTAAAVAKGVDEDDPLIRSGLHQPRKQSKRRCEYTFQINNFGRVILYNDRDAFDVNDRHIDQINDHALPSAAKRLRVAELVARGLSSFAPKLHVDVPRITKELRLPAFEYPGERYVWPHPEKRLFHRTRSIISPA